ncbi:hypothetical protein LTR37_010928 [Vermiconidia calcicola]|uniref:Uncharacterized protein n=1 Tax=Vermiconidia calcicola TaxID=1690605 RepID=A0ACC3N3I5_9PEZI|nr:hypothetical protein LTR37_010928 [Vermiconidia calcicola]
MGGVKVDEDVATWFKDLEIGKATDEISEEATSRIEQSSRELDISYYGATPTDVLNCRDGHFFSVNFVGDCVLDDVNLDNCTLINVTFEDCSLINTKWSNIFMQDVRLIGCISYDYIWQNAKLEDRTIHGEIYEDKTANGGAVPVEIADPMWLEREKNGLNVLKIDANLEGETESEINAIQNAKILGGESNARMVRRWLSHGQPSNAK